MKRRVGLLYGGRSVEHEVSVASAASILEALDADRYDISVIEVDPSGHWHLHEVDDFERLQPGKGREVALTPIPDTPTLSPSSEAGAPAIALDVIFPIIHGRSGEDGALQGLLELKEIAFVGSGVLGSAIQMDKDVTKKLLAQAGLPVVPWVCFRHHELAADGLDEARQQIEEKLGYPVFIKPANSGSSVGISKAMDAAELASGLREATRHDDKVLVEAGLDARELEVAVLGNDAPEASVAGEIIPSHDFYDYEAKYLDEATDLVIPAALSEQESQALREMAVAAFQVVEASGFARVDFLMDRHTGRTYINELNSLPGFTNGSMYPRLWEASGLPYPELLDRLIDLALERSQRRSQLERAFRKNP